MNSSSQFLASLLLLPISFKILVITNKALHGQVPGYISKHLTPYCPKRPLRSAGLSLLAVQSPS